MWHEGLSVHDVVGDLIHGKTLIDRTFSVHLRGVTFQTWQTEEDLVADITGEVDNVQYVLHLIQIDLGDLYCDLGTNSIGISRFFLC